MSTSQPQNLCGLRLCAHHQYIALNCPTPTCPYHKSRHWRYIERPSGYDVPLPPRCPGCSREYYYDHEDDFGGIRRQQMFTLCWKCWSCGFNNVVWERIYALDSPEALEDYQCARCGMFREPGLDGGLVWVADRALGRPPLGEVGRENQSAEVDRADGVFSWLFKVPKLEMTERLAQVLWGLDEEQDEIDLERKAEEANFWPCWPKDEERVKGKVEVIEEEQDALENLEYEKGLKEWDPKDAMPKTNLDAIAHRKPFRDICRRYNFEGSTAQSEVMYPQSDS